MQRGRKKKTDTGADEFEASFSKFETYLLEAACVSEQREPNQRSQDPLERSWARWIAHVRARQFQLFVRRVNDLLRERGCVPKRGKAARSARRSVPAPSSRSSRQSRRRVALPIEDQVQDVEVLSEGLPDCSAETPAQTVDGVIPKHGARYEDLAPQHREMYDSLLRFVTRPGNPRFCLARVYHGAKQCHLRPLPDQSFCAKHAANVKARQKHGIMGDTLDAGDQHRRIMLQLRVNLQRADVKWYARDIFWEELQMIRTCDNEGDYTDDEWSGALSAVDAFLRRRSSLCARMGLKPGLGPRGLQDRVSPEAKARRDYIGLVEKFRWYHRDVFKAVLEEIAPGSGPPERVCERLFVEGLRRTSEYLRDRRFPSSTDASMTLLTEVRSATFTATMTRV